MLSSVMMIKLSVDVARKSCSQKTHIRSKKIMEQIAIQKMQWWICGKNLNRGWEQKFC